MLPKLVTCAHSSVLQNFNNVMKRIQDALPEDERPRMKNRTKSKTKKGAASTSSSVNIVALGIMNPDRQNKATILDGMASAYKLRCDRRRKGESITKILEDFPQFVNYSGEVPDVSIPTFVEEKRLEAKQVVQPYFIGIVSPISKKILKFFLVLDSKAIDLHAIPSTCHCNIFESASDEAPPSCVEAYRLITSS
ncbi:Glutamyl-tRNA(Gln) amidotransferase subunit A [Frankliniella fusca]|uniref:Glutamyl-tRNA(Gln) amidotransferase subunit A n=1 Tax=Frankliniella fusca TaxID=407009 RepID=A0AAE1HI50_9NEOP|nr:Glutamyl-tRNA(Gln) amidotransferase subunit A [Frankliniella fusca]